MVVDGKCSRNQSHRVEKTQVSVHMGKKTIAYECWDCGDESEEVLSLSQQGRLPKAAPVNEA